MKIKQKKKGISLIVLVITIIVMIILAAAIILSLNSSGIIGKSNEAKLANDIANIKEKAEFIKNQELLRAQENKQTLTQAMLIGAIKEGFENSVVSENVILVYNKYDIVVETDLSISVTTHEAVKILSGNNQSYHSLAPSTLAFRSSADISDFKEVQINGETLEPSNYTLTEGSTIVTVSIDYLKTLPADNYTLNIVSKTGTGKANFEVIVPETNEHGFYYKQPYTAYTAAFGEDLVFFIREDGAIDVIGCSSRSIQTGSYIVDGNNLTINGIYGGPFTGTISPDGTEIYCNELKITYRLGGDSAVADEDYLYIYNKDLGGYEVRAIDKTKSSYGAIKTGINGYTTVKIMQEAFAGSGNVIAVAPEIPEGVTIIGERAFNYCTNLETVIIPQSVTKIEAGVFRYCTKLKSITFRGTIAEWNSIDFGENWAGQDEPNNLGTIPVTEVKCSDGTVSLK